MKNPQSVAQIINLRAPPLRFTVLEVGAVPLGDSEPFYGLLSHYPGSRVVAIEVDPQLCAELNRNAQPGLCFYPNALGRTQETRPFYETVHPMCASLYKPNEPLLDRYNGLEVAKLKTTGSIDTVSLDEFVRMYAIGPIDFIKIDIQGAELDVFAGGVRALTDTLGIVSEVEFVPLYEDQPLFGDVCRFLAGQGIAFHKFLGIAGRTLRPILINNDPNLMSQQLWADAIFLRDLARVEVLTSQQLLKMAVLANLYASPDVAAVCFLEYDRREGTDLAPVYMAL